MQKRTFRFRDERSTFSSFSFSILRNPRMDILPIFRIMFRRTRRKTTAKYRRSIPAGAGAKAIKITSGIPKAPTMIIEMIWLIRNPAGRERVSAKSPSRRISVRNIRITFPRRMPSRRYMPNSRLRFVNMNFVV